MKRLALALIAASILAVTGSANAALIHEWQGDGNANDSILHSIDRLNIFPALAGSIVQAAS